MATYYVSSEIMGADAGGITGADTTFQAGTIAADDGNPGTEAQPFRTFDGTDGLGTDGVQGISSSAGPGPGDVVYACGRMRSSIAPLTGYTLLSDRTIGGGSFEIRQWPGKPTLCFRGELIPGGTVAGNKLNDATHWVSVGNGFAMVCDGNSGKLNLSAVTGLSTVTYGWDHAAYIDASGRHKSHAAAYAYDAVSDATTIATMLAGARDVQAKWFFGTHDQPGRIAFLPHSGAGAAGAAITAAPANGIEVVPLGRSGISFQDSGGATPHTGITVAGESSTNKMRFQRFTDATQTAPLGSPLNALNTTNTTFQDLLFEDVGDHAWAFGTKVVNANTIRCDVNGYAPACVAAVWNASGGGNSATGSCVDSTMYLQQLLGHDGNRTQTNTGSFGFYVHGPHSGITVTGLRIIGYTQTSGAADVLTPWESDAPGVVPSNLASAATYPVVMSDCRATNVRLFQNQTITTYIGFIKCGIYATENVGAHVFNTANFTGRWRFEGCELVASYINSDGAAALAFCNIGAAFTFSLLNCSVYDMAASHSANVYSFARYNAAPDDSTGKGVIASGCIFGYCNVDTGTFQVIDGDSLVGVGHMLFTDCLYFNIGATTWADNSTRNAAAEFVGAAGTIDTNGINNSTTSPFTDATGAALGLTEAAKATRKYLSTYSGVSFNGAGYGGNYGANQYPTGGNWWQDWIMRQQRLRRRKRQQEALDEE